MENQHHKISKDRELSQTEIDLINAVKEKEVEFLSLLEQVSRNLNDTQRWRRVAMSKAVAFELMKIAEAEMKRFQSAEPFRWLEIAKTDIQTASMAAVRAIAQPTT